MFSFYKKRTLCNKIKKTRNNTKLVDDKIFII